MKQQQGFTLIELIVVIIILGILAATALPKFSNLSADARVAKMAAIAGALKSTSSMAHGNIVAEGLYSSSSVKLQDSTLLAMSAYYPTATPGGINLGGDITSGIDVTGYVVSYPITSPGVLMIFPDQAHALNESCGVSYVAANFTAGVSTPVVDATWASAVIPCT